MSCLVVSNFVASHRYSQECGFACTRKRESRNNLDELAPSLRQANWRGMKKFKAEGKDLKAIIPVVILLGPICLSYVPFEILTIDFYQCLLRHVF